MGNFFNMDNGFFTTLSKLCDILLLSILWLLLCIPIVTIGPATTAMYYATVKVIRRERGYLFREFFKSFRQNFLNGAIFGVILTAIYVILIIDRISVGDITQTNEKMGVILFYVYNTLIIMVTFFTMYLFPILSRFSMTRKQLFKTAFIMSLRHLPSTIVMAAIILLFVVISMTVPILMFVAPCSAIFLCSFLMERIFKKYMPKSEGEAKETGKDEWYLE